MRHRRTRRRGGANPLKAVVLAALAGLSLQQPSAALTWSELTNGPMPKARIEEVASNIVKWVDVNRPKGIVEWTLPQLASTLETVNRELSGTTIPASKMGNGGRYTWDDKTFEVESWENLQNGTLKVFPRVGEPFILGINEPVEEVSQPVKEVSQPDEDVGGQRRKRRKTLRRKK
jgi:hypothetical protein